MKREHRILSLIFFLLKFLFFAAIITPLWWLLLPYYGYFLVQLSGGILRNLLSLPVEAVQVQPLGLLNTESNMVFYIGGHQFVSPMALLITNMAPYIAIVLATEGLGIRRRLWVLLSGAAILALGHILFIVVLLRFLDVLNQYQDLPIALIQFYLTLPILLWIILAYWTKIAALLNEESPEDPPQKAA